MTAYPQSVNWTRKILFLTLATASLISLPEARAALVTVSNQVITVEQNQNASAFFTANPDNSTTLTNVLATTSSFSGTAGAGDAATTTSTGLFTLVGSATSAGNWKDGNGVPAGITLTFTATFTVSTPDAGSFLTTEANSGTSLGNGIGVTQVAGSVGTTTPGETMVLSAINISSVVFTGSMVESGFTFTPGTVGNAKWNRLRSNNLTEASEGTTATVGGSTWGFGTSTGNTGSNLIIDNNYNAIPGFLTAGPITFSTEAGAWNIKGVGFQYEINYDIAGVAVTPTWTGGGANDNWSTGANWTGGLAPTSGQPIRFGASTRQSNTNDIVGLNLPLIVITNGGFSLYGNTITNGTGVSNLVGSSSINLGLVYTGNVSRVLSVVSGSQLSIGGSVYSYNNGNIEVSGGGTLNVVAGGFITMDANTLSGNLRIGMAAGETNTVNINAGGVINIPDALSGTAANRIRIGAVNGSSAIVNVNSGGQLIAADNPINELRSLVEVGQSPSVVSELNLNAGGVILAQRIESGDVGADASFHFNGGLLKAHKITASTTYFLNFDRVQVRAGGAIIDTTNNMTFSMPLTEDPANTGGGLTKVGVGGLILPAGNTYTGPTVVSNGSLSLSLPLSSTSVALRSNTSLSLTVNSSSWSPSSVTLDSTNVINLDFGGSGPSSTPINTTTLNANGVTTLNVSGSFTTTGSYPLIAFGSRAGNGTFVLGTRPSGTIATLVTNIGTSSIDLLVTDIANDLLWTGNVDGDWDVGIKLNWDFLTGGSGATTYEQNTNSGDFVSFFNGPANTSITLKTNVNPTLMNFQNSSTPYSIGGVGFGITGPTRMLIQGGGAVTLTSSNSFSGGVSNILGFVAAGNNSALGTGLVSLSPIVTGLKTTGLYSDGSTARTLNNPLQLRAFSATELNLQLGDATANGKLTLAGPVDMSNRRNELSIESPVEFTGLMTNGCFSKAGPSTLTFKGTSRFTAADAVINQGDLIINGGAWTNSTFGLRLVAADGLTARVILTNNGIITLEGGSNLRVGGATAGSFAQGNGTNEFIMYSGTLNCIGNSGLATIGNAASLSAFSRITFNSGSVICQGLNGLTNAGPTELVLNGVNLSSSTSGGNVLSSFISGFTNAYVQGVVTIDITNGITAIAAQSLQGSGSITKTGAGTLNLNGANSYSGSTVVNAGALGGSGVLAGPLTVNASGTLSPGNSIGTLTVNNSATLSGTVFVEVDKGALTSDLVTGLTSISYGGSLVVSNISGTPLAGGEVFQLFNVSGAKNNNFTSVTILPATGATGTFSPATGQLTINNTAPPVFNPITVSGGNLVWTGSGFAANGTYSILTSTNVAAPLSTWTTNATGTFSGTGVFSNAIPVGTTGNRFFLLKTP